MNHEIQTKDAGGGLFATIDCDIIYPITTVMELGMIKGVLSGGMIEWRDLQFVNLTGKLTVETEETNALLIEQSLKRPVDWELTSFDGVYPMGPGIDYATAGMECGTFSIDITKGAIKPNRDPRGFVNQYDLEYITASPCFLGWLQTPTVGECDSNPINLGGVGLPFPAGRFGVNNNEKQPGILLNGRATGLDTPLIEFGEITTFDLVLSVQQATNLQILFLQSRGGEMPLTIAPIAGVFGQQYREGGDFVVVLADEKITFTQINFDQIRVSFKLQNTQLADVPTETVYYFEAGTTEHPWDELQWVKVGAEEITFTDDEANFSTAIGATVNYTSGIYGDIDIAGGAVRLTDNRQSLVDTFRARDVSGTNIFGTQGIRNYPAQVEPNGVLVYALNNGVYQQQWLSIPPVDTNGYIDFVASVTVNGGDISFSVSVFQSSGLVGIVTHTILAGYNTTVTYSSELKCFSGVGYYGETYLQGTGFPYSKEVPIT